MVLHDHESYVCMSEWRTAFGNWSGPCIMTCRIVSAVAKAPGNGSGCYDIEISVCVVEYFG